MTSFSCPIAGSPTIRRPRRDIACRLPTFRAPLVISDAGALNTLTRLLPDQTPEARLQIPF
ncbi:hypothetical protein C8259_13055 [Nocardia nova]|uniref:Uncharacterized protein n=1 Tax=Nocardia nova TaxID=37330 RepID=A0A2T2Z733_9NOCA|nr:hypothetical protein C8259_13055 [Nocardia nova]